MAAAKAQVSLREITRHNIKAILALSVSAEQKKVYPRSNSYSIAEGHFPADDDPVWMRAIYADKRPVGFIMTSEAPEDGIYFLWRIMIDQHHQGLGYGRRAIEILIDRIYGNGNPQHLLTSHHKGDGNAGIFYQKLGFHYTGELIGNMDLMMKLDFKEIQTIQNPEANARPHAAND